MVDMLVDVTTNHRFFNFIDGKSCSIQIFIAKEDTHKTTFMCPRSLSIYEWIVMPFKLKNVGTTYQRAINVIFHYLIGKTIEVSIDDVVIKSKYFKNHFFELE